jgi:hypothetical protein
MKIENFIVPALTVNYFYDGSAAAARPESMKWENE